MDNAILIVLIVVLVGGALAYVIKAKKSGKKCIGCPHCDSCPSLQKEGRDSHCGCHCGCTADRDNAKDEP